MQSTSWERIAITTELSPSYYTSTANQCYKAFSLWHANMSFLGAITNRDQTITEVVAGLHASGSHNV